MNLREHDGSKVGMPKGTQQVLRRLLAALLAVVALGLGSPALAAIGEEASLAPCEEWTVGPARVCQPALPVAVQHMQAPQKPGKSASTAPLATRAGAPRSETAPRARIARFGPSAYLQFHRFLL